MVSGASRPPRTVSGRDIDGGIESQQIFSKSSTLSLCWRRRKGEQHEHVVCGRRRRPKRCAGFSPRFLAQRPSAGKAPFSSGQGGPPRVCPPIGRGERSGSALGKRAIHGSRGRASVWKTASEAPAGLRPHRTPRSDPTGAEEGDSRRKWRNSGRSGDARARSADLSAPGKRRPRAFRRGRTRKRPRRPEVATGRGTRFRARSRVRNFTTVVRMGTLSAAWDDS